MLTQNQKDFLLNIFFVHEHYSGWKGIAEKLLDKGKCVVAGDRCIWSGGIGNFIKTKEHADYFGCLEYTFDIKIFLGSQFYTFVYNEYMKEQEAELDALEKKYDEMKQLNFAKFKN